MANEVVQPSTPLLDAASVRRSEHRWPLRKTRPAENATPMSAPAASATPFPPKKRRQRRPRTFTQNGPVGQEGKRGNLNENFPLYFSVFRSRN